jgi:tetratricopeptide (TPR) repeat protein
VLRGPRHAGRDAARALAERGEFDEANAQAHDAFQIAEELDHHPFSLTWAYLSLGYVHSVRGELGQAVRWLERAAAHCRDGEITLLYPNAMAWLGHVYAVMGRVEEGVSWLKQAVTATDSGRIGYLALMSLVQLGEAYLLANRSEDAGECADRALRLARERGQRGHEAWALRLLGEIASHSDRLDVAPAEAHYGAAMALAAELGMRPLVAHCHLGLGGLYRRTAQETKAKEHLTTAAAQYGEMGMPFWLEKAEAASVALR